MVKHIQCINHQVNILLNVLILNVNNVFNVLINKYFTLYVTLLMY